MSLAFVNNQDNRLWVYAGITVGAISVTTCLYYLLKHRREGGQYKPHPTHIQGKLRDTSTLGNNWNSAITTKTTDKFVGCILGVVCGDMLGAG